MWLQAGEEAKAEGRQGQKAHAQLNLTALSPQDPQSPRSEAKNRAQVSCFPVISSSEGPGFLPEDPKRKEPSRGGFPAPGGSLGRELEGRGVDGGSHRHDGNNWGVSGQGTKVGYQVT